MLGVVLSAEQQSIGMLLTPVDLEETCLGNSFITLRDAICQQKNTSVQPFNYVSLRVLVQIANILQHKQEILPFEDLRAGDDVASALLDFQRNKLEEMIQTERSFWVDPCDIFGKMDQDMFNEFTHQH